MRACRPLPPPRTASRTVAIRLRASRSGPISPSPPPSHISAWQPLFLQTLLGYTAFYAGLSVTPRGSGAVVGILLVGALVSRVNPKILVAVGFVVLGLSSLLLSRLTLLQQSTYWAFADVFYAVACFCGICVLCVPIFRRPTQVRAVALSE